jgi:hypothetical protein
MKAKNVTMMVLAMMMSLAAFAGKPGKPQMVVVSQKPGVFKVIYEGGISERVNLRIVNEAGLEVYSEVIRSENGFSRPINFSGMLDGDYTIELTDKNGKQEHTITYHFPANNNSIAYPSIADKVHIAKTSEAGKYLLAIVHQGSDRLNVKIYDGEDTMILDKNLTVSGNFGLVYNLIHIKGSPTFEVTDQSGKVKTVKY